MAEVPEAVCCDRHLVHLGTCRGSEWPDQAWGRSGAIRDPGITPPRRTGRRQLVTPPGRG
jgi:hypothetical protein